MKTLIIGSKGFIGKHCVDYFSAQSDNEVHGCDVVVDYTEKNYHLIDGSNSDYNSIFDKISFDVCINCSGAASVPHSLQNPSRDYQLNTINVFKILESIRKHVPYCKFINLSSAAVYGNPEYLPIKESQAINPVSPYGYHKWQSEIICKEMSEQFGLKTASLRIFSAYGQGLYKQLFWDLYEKFKTNNNRIELFGTGEESRDFIHVLDIVQTIDLCIQKLSFQADILNVANGEEILIKDVVRLFYDLLGEEVEISFKGNNRQGDPSNWVADIGKIREIGYKSNINISKGLSNYIEWLKELE